jgi:hypothetical protein
VRLPFTSKGEITMVALKVGNVVKLRSGGVAMTMALVRDEQTQDFDKNTPVRELITVPASGKAVSKPRVALCLWMVTGQLHDGLFPLETLALVKTSRSKSGY